MLLCFASLSMVLLGCSTVPDEPKPVVVKTEVPPTLRHCRDVDVPRDIKTQKDVAAFLPTLAAGYVDCKDKLKTVVGLVDAN